ncbi:teichoic acids export ABC transporter ATP-binding subunit TagH [Neobacillus sp. LXY-1]|uniref:teichoic acids export ABC transporter ATP-binding subunit TagH n=1 Tax=Neobacillus sp. LXY-1 TaxID=3379133 RepID=UPI003EE1C347
MCARPKVIFKNVSKKYTLQQKKLDTIFELLGTKKTNRGFYALKNISFTVNEGETIGVIGINGSGKSTLSNVLAQVIPPTSGELEVNGETSLIAISVGLNNNLTGMENIELKCLMHGMRKEEIKQLTPKIIEFADIGDFINQPVKSYSSGMKSRLGFAISAHTNPDIMVVDEALSVGDQTFYEKCITKMNEFKAEGKTIFFISHSISQIRTFCDKTMWIHYGEMVEFGDTSEVLAKYNEFIKYFNALSEAEKAAYKKEKMAGRQAEGESTSSRRRRKRNERQSQKSVYWEMGVLLVLFFFSAMLVLFNNNTPVKGIDKLDINKANSKMLSKSELKSSSIGQAINKTGYIVEDHAPVFKTAKLNRKLSSLNFLNKVMVKRKIGNVYEITSRGKKGFIQQESVHIQTPSLTQQDFTLAGSLNALPNSFRNSYQYYLAFLGSEKSRIEAKIKYKTGEEEDGLGNTYIIYDKVKYRINHQQLSDRIVVNEFMPEETNLEEITNKATLISKDKKKIYILTKQYEYIFDLNRNTLTIAESKK